MTAQPTNHLEYEFNGLRRGSTYRAVTTRGIAVGEYLGMESLHGDHAILLRNPAGTESIVVCDVTALESAAA